MTALSSATVATLSVSTPTYDRDAASVGIVHFGVGNFSRSHAARYLDLLMEFVELHVLFGDLGADATFVAEYLACRRSLAERGVHATLDDLLA